MPSSCQSLSPDSSKASFWQLLLSSIGTFSVVGCLCLSTFKVLRASVLAWRIPGMGEPGGLPSMGSHRIGHD